MQRTQLQTADGDSIELQTGFDAGDNARLAHGPLFVNFDDVDIAEWDHGAYVTVWLRYGDRLVSSVDVDAPIARRLAVEVGRDDSIDYVAP